MILVLNNIVTEKKLYKPCSAQLNTIINYFDASNSFKN